MRLMRAKDIEAIDTMKHWVEYEKANKRKIKNADELIQMQETILELVDNLERHLMEFYEGELYTAKQLKNIENTQKEYYIRKDDLLKAMNELIQQEDGKFYRVTHVINELKDKLDLDGSK